MEGLLYFCEFYVVFVVASAVINMHVQLTV
jgi:hypothetical protein